MSIVKRSFFMLIFFILAGVSWFLMANRTQVVLVSNSPQAAHAQCQSEMMPSLLEVDWSHKGDEMVFIDEGVEHIEMLLPKLAAYEVQMIKRDADGVQQISDALSARDNLSGLHIISHGGSGSLLLGDGYLSMATLDHYADSLALWGQSLSQEADILLYGCHVAAGQTGQAFIQQLATLTGADIAASDDLTGSAKQGGDWQLELAQGHLDTQALPLPQNYPAVLDYEIEQNDSNTTTESGNWGQSFLTIGAGNITKIEVHTAQASAGCTLTIYDGEGIAGTDLHHQRVDLSVGVNEITLTNPVAVNADSTYSFYLSHCENSFSAKNSRSNRIRRAIRRGVLVDSISLEFSVSVSTQVPSPEIEVTGNSNAIDHGSDTAQESNHTNFGSTNVSDGTVDRTFTIKNTGTADLTLGEPYAAVPATLGRRRTPAVSISGANADDFTLTNQPPPGSTIASGQTTTFSVQFDPRAAGTRTATIRIPNNDSDEDPFTFAIQGTGDDNDGVDGTVEENVPGLNGHNTGDGNGDGTPDNQQAHVASLKSNTDDYVTFATDEGKQLVNVQPETEPTGAPTQTQFPYGHFSFQLTGLSNGDAVSVKLIMHGDQSTPTTFWKYGPTPDNRTDHWYEFTYDGRTGAQISGNTITLHFVDGERGDSDLEENGKISDPGAPAVTSAPPPPPAPTAIPNQPPQASPSMPDITVVEGAADQIINPLNYFSDPEGDVFLLSVTGNSNPSVVPNLPAGHFLGNVDQMKMQFGQVGQTEITLQAKEMRSNATVEDTFTVTVLERPTLSMSKGVSDASVYAGQRITYTIAITNSGPSTVTYALLSDTLPLELSFVNGSISANGITTGTIGSTLPDLFSRVTISPSTSLDISFAATVSDTVLANQTITNSAQLTATEVSAPLRASNVIQVISPTLSITDSHANEAAGTMEFALTLSRASAIPVTLDFTTVAASATITDYTPISGTLTIPAKAISGTLSVAINDDTLVEANETFTVQLSNAANATISDGEAVGTITDNDDADGIDNDIENQVPNPSGSGTGDGNGDGIPDSLQNNVASLPNGTNGDYVTFAVANDQTLNNVQAESVPADAPAEADFSQGVFSWGATGLGAGDAMSITLILHTADSANLPNSYWKYGPTPDNASDHWYNFTFDGTTGAEINGNTITLHFVDGQRGDSDMTANGQISDPGGPAIYSAPTALTLTDIGSQAPIARHAGAFASLALLLVGGLFVARRRKEQ